ncbi:MAG TPA: hypothetical protein PLN21_09965 [Gemmatales bacterium]|nr:hypothetical protein [Gemmatales bacterium]
MCMLPPDPAKGEALKQAAFRLLEAKRERLVRSARRALLIHLLMQGTATIDDVRAVVPVPPGMDPRAFGAAPSMLALAGIIRFVGYAKTVRPVGHRHPVSVWELADPTAAEAWLASHPELPEAQEGGTTHAQ